MNKIIISAVLTLATMSAMSQTKKYAVTKTDADWRKQLTAEQYQVTRQKGPKGPLPASTGIITRTGSINVSAAGRSSSALPANSKVEQAGQASGCLLKKIMWKN
jgi:hypothetical protein